MLLKRSNYSFKDFSVKTEQNFCRIMFGVNTLSFKFDADGKFIRFDINNLLVGKIKLDDQKVEIIENKYHKFDNDVDCVNLRDEESNFSLSYSVDAKTSQFNLKIYFYDSNNELHEGEFVFDISCN